MTPKLKSSPSPSLVAQMREEGRSLSEVGVFEIDLLENKVTWANDYVMDRSGYTLDQIKHVTVNDIVPNSFHNEMQEAIAEIANRKPNEERKPTSIWPIQTPNGKITWWSVTKTVTEYPLIWLHGDHIQTTAHSGVSFVFMRAFMNAANRQTGLHDQISELKEWTATQIERLDGEDKRLYNGLESLSSKLNESLSASRDAAEAARASTKMVEILQQTFHDVETKYGTEILKLIGTDTLHDKRIDAFESHIKMAADLAVKSIEMQAKTSSAGIMRQAEESSKGISRKIVIPVSVIAGIVTIIQILVERFVK